MENLCGSLSASLERLLLWAIRLWKPRGLLRETTIVRNLLWKPRSLPRDTTKNSGNPFVEALRLFEGDNQRLWRIFVEVTRPLGGDNEPLWRSFVETSRRLDGDGCCLGTFVEAPRPLEGDSERLQKTFLEILRLSRETTNGCGQPLWTSGNGYNEPMQKPRVRRALQFLGE